MKRYYREENGNIYDREKREWIQIHTEALEKNHYRINFEKIIDKNEVEEKK